MAILGNLINKGIKLRESLDQEYSSPFELQKLELKKLLITARDTKFGVNHGFKEILDSFKSQDFYRFYDIFKKQIPPRPFDKMFDEWWYRTKNGEKNVCWPGKIKFFALSSGTSGATSKYIPITKDQIKAIRKTSIRQLLTLSKYELPDEFFTAGVMMLGGSTQLSYNGTFFEGDLSGITASHIPFWFQQFYKPGQKIAKNVDWGKKLDEITKKAKKWDIGVIAGVPAWVQILIEKIIAYYHLKDIHEIWPNFRIFVHGGVALQPYMNTFEKLLGKPMIYIETYLASEGFLAFQSRPNADGMKLVLNNGIFYEFIPFDQHNFNDDGEMIQSPQTFTINQIEEGKEYALLISTCSGAWRYLIGDTVKLVNRANSEIVITGRTKHFLSLCGEHTTVDNMNQAVKFLDEEFNLGIKEYTVCGISTDSFFAHHWYIGVEKNMDSDKIRNIIDNHLKNLNDDYRVERDHALKDVNVTLVPNQFFYEFMRGQGKEGGQNKFPRVIKGEKLKQWKAFLAKKNVPD